MSTLTGGTLNLIKPELTDDHKVTIGTDLPANFQKVDDEFSAHLAETVTDADGAHGLKIENGTWTPSTDTANLTVTVAQARYTKNDKTVEVFCYVTLNNTSGSEMVTHNIIGLPFGAVGYGTAYKCYGANAFTAPIYIEAGYSFIRCNEPIPVGESLAMYSATYITN